MHDDPYSLSDLCRFSGVTPRTVRYYVAQGLLRSPDAAGPSTRYGEGHLARLRLIKRLQREHLPLAEIRNRLERLDDQAVQDLLGESPAPDQSASADTQDTLSFVRGLLARTGISPSQLPVSEPAFERSAPARRTSEVVADAMYAVRARPSMHTLVSPPAPAAMAAPVPLTHRALLEASEPDASPSALTGAADRSTWERLSISPDVEIHVRRPLDRLSNKRVEHLARLARELFGEER